MCECFCFKVDQAVGHGGLCWWQWCIGTTICVALVRAVVALLDAFSNCMGNDGDTAVLVIECRRLAKVCFKEIVLRLE